MHPLQQITDIPRHIPEEEYRAAHPYEVRIYDIATDGFRTATQGDVDRMARTCQAYGRVRELAAKSLGNCLEEIENWRRSPMKFG